MSTFNQASVTPPASPPPTLAGLISGYSWSRNGTGCSGAEVFHLHAEKRPGMYLKRASHSAGHPLEPERRRLEWLHGRLPAPAVLGFAADTEAEYLLLSEVPGIPAYRPEHHGNIPRLIELLATGLRTIHSLSVPPCPFRHFTRTEIAAAEQRMNAGLVDESDFDDTRLGRRAHDLFDELLRTIPADEDLVFTHGDYCLPNIIIDGDEIGGFIDMGRAGIGDRWRDLALAARSIVFNLGGKWAPRFFEAYGVEADRRKMEFFLLLDEFF